MPTKTDAKDIKLLRILCNNARLSHNKIGKELGLTKNAVRARIEKLEKAGVISGYTTLINHKLAGYNFFEFFIKLSSAPAEEKAIIDELLKNPNLIVMSKSSGEWDYVLEFGCVTMDEFQYVIKDVLDRYSMHFADYDIHPILESYKVEQFPIAASMEKYKPVGYKTRDEAKGMRFRIDTTDKKILRLLNIDSTMPILNIAREIGMTAEAVSARVKKLVKSEFIQKFSARVDVRKLGYEMFLITIRLSNFSEFGKLQKFIVADPRVRFAFLSSVRPTLFIYYAVENLDSLDRYMREIYGKFSDCVTGMRYLILIGLPYYNMFPEGLMRDK